MNTEHRPASGAPHQRSAYDFTEQVGYLLRRAYQKHLAAFQSESSDLQLTSVQFSTLSALREGGQLSQAELVKATGVDQATIRGIVHRLKSRGFVTLSKDPADARKVIYSATQAGSDVLENMIPRSPKITEAMYGGLNPAERAALLYTLRKMLGEEGQG